MSPLVEAALLGQAAAGTIAVLVLYFRISRTFTRWEFALELMWKDYCERKGIDTTAAGSIRGTNGKSARGAIGLG